MSPKPFRLTDSIHVVRLLVLIVVIFQIAIASASAQKFWPEPAESPHISEAVVITYDPQSGEIDRNSGVLISTLELISEQCIFITEPMGPRDVNTPCKQFRLLTNGIGYSPLGIYAPPGLTWQQLWDDLEIRGSYLPGSRLTEAPGGGPYLYVVPEPRGTFAWGLALPLLMHWRRRNVARE